MTRFLPFLFLITLIACQDDPISDINTDDTSIIIISNTLYESAPNDPFYFESVKIVNDRLLVSINYGGGCGNIEYKLIDAGTIAESYPVQRMIRLSFKDDDSCEALISKTCSFDLSPIKANDYGKIRLNLDGWEEQLLYEY